MIDGNSIAESIKARAKSQGVDPMQAMRLYAMERLIIRLKMADFRDEMILKGGMMWALNPLLKEHARPTADIDLHFYEPLSHDEVLALFAATHDIVLDDGCRFDFHHPKALEHTGDHEGLRVKVRAWIGNRFVDFHSDIGFGGTKPDLIEETFFRSMHPKVDGGSTRLVPIEYQVAEKLHAIVKLGIVNTRLKDYNDLFVYSGMKLSDDRLIEAIRTTFSDRDTEIPTEPTVGFTDEYADLNQDQWVGWVAQAGRQRRISGDFKDVVARVSEFATISFEKSAVPAMRMA